MLPGDGNSGVITVLARLDRALAALEIGLAAAFMAFAALTVIADVVARATLNMSFSWANEATRYAIIWMTFLGAAMGARRGAHISIDVLSEMLPPAVALLTVRAAAGVASVTCLVLCAVGVQLVARMAGFGQTSPAMLAPMWLVYCALPLGFGLMGLHYARRAFDPDRAGARAAMAASAG